jgi:flagellar biogenesis protein FliO
VELVLFCSSTMESPDWLRFDVFCISSRIRLLEFFFLYIFMVRSGLDSCDFQGRFSIYVSSKNKVGVRRRLVMLIVKRLCFVIGLWCSLV